MNPQHLANGQNLRALGFRVESVSPRRQIPLSPNLTDQARSAGTFLGSMGGNRRKLTVSGNVVGSSWATGQAAQDALVDILSPGLVSFEEVTDYSHLVIDGKLDGQPSVSDYSRSFRHRVARFSFALTVDDGSWRAPSGNPVGISQTNTRYALPQGTAPTALIARIAGSATNPILTIRSADGQTLSALSFTVTLASADWLDIDGERGKIDLVTSGTRTNGANLLTSGTFPIRLPLGSWNYRASSWPTAEVSAGTAEILYTKRYW